MVSSQDAAQKIDYSLCGFCRDLDLHVYDFLPSRGDLPSDHQAKFQRIMLPPYSVVRDYGCSFCRFMYSAILDGNTKDNGDLQAKDVKCGLEWVKDGRRFSENEQDISSTRRLRVFAVNDRLKDVYLVLVAPTDSTEQFLGRRVHPASIDMPRVCSWLTECETHHGICHDDPDSAVAELLYQNPSFRVVDVENECIVQAQRQPFLALSYCWGGSAQDTTTRESFEEYSSRGGLGPSKPGMPDTVRDAMRLTKRLGYRYLWVDRYCIMQDDQEDWAAIVTFMDSVYNLAALTICAADGDSYYGIPGATEYSRTFRQLITAYDRSMELMVSHPAETFIKESLWNTRAWTFQERLCARRCLIFVSGRVFYQCRHSTMCEDLHMEDSQISRGLQTWSLELKDAPGRLFLENPLRQYTKSVELFTQRNLSFPKDKMPAFSAIETLLSENMDSDFRAGLPTAYFDFALLWMPRAPLYRIKDYPSWSWCGWNEAIEYSFSTLEGVLVNLQEWLSSRTWIVWHARTISGAHGSVWDGRRNGVPGRWGGYPQSKSVVDPNCMSNIHLYPLRQRNFDQGLVLQFFTHSAFFTIDPAPPVRISSTEIHSDLHWHSLSDAEGDWCGTVLLSQDWVNNMGDRAYQFIAISEARDFSAEEHDSWTYYVPRDRIDSQWDLYYVLLIVTDEDGVSERVGLGKVFKDAFKKSQQPGYFWREILLR